MMEWSIPVYSGLKANGIGSNWRLGMYELCREVNRREYPNVIHRTKFQWSGITPKSDLTYDDLDGINVQFKAEANLKLIQGAIRSMCSRFTTTRGGDIQWTVETLEDAIGYDLGLDPESATESRFWQAQQAALDRLIYTRATRSCIGGYNYGGNRSKTGFEQGMTPDYATFQDAWDDRFYSAVPPSTMAFAFGTRWILSSNAGYISTVQLGSTLLTYTEVNALEDAIPFRTKYMMLGFSNGTSDFRYTIGSASGVADSEDTPAAPIPPYRTKFISTDADDFGSGNTVLIVPMADQSTVPFDNGFGADPRVMEAIAVSATTYYELL